MRWHAVTSASEEGIMIVSSVGGGVSKHHELKGVEEVFREWWFGRTGGGLGGLLFTQTKPG